MARRRRRQKPLLPGLWTVLVAFALLGSIGGFYWVLGKKTHLVRNDAPPAAAVAKRK
ncbi:hypothetical protein [Prosthecobacter vanneervenii]|uniref:Uncharacterized protein n=1 Tax=Prosthecobacter vanneervenii TaxID=48466 RepID=A0A7W7Y7Q9_9BACT|nr:hypothetical protein [Prosthecobacter vanneervenii]MBB5031186.1 hypothetical protein [Prosthecobacter vanneervenii]